METKKSNNADLENKRWIGFALGLIIALSIFFVAMEYSAQDGEEKEVNTNLLKDLKLHDQEMLPAIDQQNLTKEKDDKAPTVEDMLNIKRSETPQKVTPHEVGNTESDDDKTAAPNINETPTLTQQATSLPDPTKVEEVAKKETNKFTEDNSDKKIERSDDKIKKRILSETPTPPGGWSSFMVWLTKNIKYPASAKQSQRQGAVDVTFIVNADGNVSDIKIKNSKNTDFEQEVFKVVRTMGKWKPGIQNNRPCKSLLEIPIVFSL